MEQNLSHVCTIENLSGEHAKMEMVLSSLFDDSFTAHEYGLIANNNQIEYKITKKLGVTKMTARAIAPCEPNQKYQIKFTGRPFILNKRSYLCLGLDIIDFSECEMK